MSFIDDLLRKITKRDKEEKFETTEDKAKKKIVTIAIIFAALFLIIFLATGGSGNKKPAKSAVSKSKTVVEAPAEKIDITKEEWTLKSASRLQALEEATTKQEQEINSLKAKTDSIEARLKRTEQSLDEMRKTMSEIKDLILQQGVGQYQATQQAPYTQQAPQQQIPQPQTPVQAPVQETPKRIRVTKPTSSRSDTSSTSLAKAPVSSQEIVPQSGTRILLPAGSFMRVRFLSGVYAPCNDVEIPVLMEVISPAITPKDRKNFVGAFIIGSAIGDYSSKRALVRLETFSLVYEDTVYSVPAKGWIVSSKDGKYGIGGKIYDRSGKYLAYAITSAFISGVGLAVGSKFQTVTTTPLGGTQTVVDLETTRDIGVYAGAIGLQRTANTLAQYFMKKADSVVPVVELPAGTIADVVLLEELKI